MRRVTGRSAGTPRPGPTPRRGAMLAIVFVFSLIQILVLAGVQQGVVMLALTEERLGSVSDAPEPGVLALQRALDLLRAGEVVDPSTRSVSASHGGTTYVYSACFELLSASQWKVTITPPADLPADLAYPNVSWP